MKDFKKLINESLNEVILAGIKPGNIISWDINKRAKTRWGLCKRYPNGDCEIQIAERLLIDDRISEKDCKETIIHEILHTCDGCHGHTGMWKAYADIMNRKYGYNIKRVTTGNEKGVENYVPKSEAYKYAFICKNCGSMILRKRQCRFTTHYKKYGCAKCGRFGTFKPVL